MPEGHVAVPDDIRHRRAGDGGDQLADLVVGGKADVLETVVVNRDTFRVRIIILVFIFVGVGNDEDARGGVVGDAVLEYLDLGVGHHHHAGAHGDAADNVTGGREIGGVVVDHRVVEHAHRMAALLGQARQVEYQNAAGVVARHVVIDVGHVAVLDLDTGDVVFGQRVADDDVVGLAHIDARVRRAARHRAVDQHVLAGNGIQAVGAVQGIRPVGPFSAHAQESDAVGADHLDGVALGVLDGEIHQRHAGAFHQKAFGAGFLAAEGQDGLVHARALDGHVVHVERQAVAEFVAARAEFDDRAGFGHDQRLLDGGVGVGCFCSFCGLGRFGCGDIAGAAVLCRGRDGGCCRQRHGQQGRQEGSRRAGQEASCVLDVCDRRHGDRPPKVLLPGPVLMPASNPSAPGWGRGSGKLPRWACGRFMAGSWRAHGLLRAGRVPMEPRRQPPRWVLRAGKGDHLGQAATRPRAWISGHEFTHTVRFSGALLRACTCPECLKLKQRIE